jgi:glycosyltransferase involved in cell wall biosynthesis
MSDLPRLLIISEVTFNQHSMGAGRTLFNLFAEYPPDRLLGFAPDSYLEAYPPDPHFTNRVIPFSEGVLPALRNRLGQFMNPFVNGVNLQWLASGKVPQLKQLEDFSPDIILICPITPVCLVMGHRISQHFQCPSLIYFMDDWIATTHTRWLSGSIQSTASELLQQASGWLMISKQLQADLSARYHLTPQRSLVVHNPVDLTGKEPPEPISTDREVFRIAYAGSIWAMHYDVLAAIAAAVSQLKQDGVAIELVLYTASSFWQQYQQHWEQWQVVYGGLIPYHALNEHLQQANLLLVTSSFLADHAYMIRSSVFTKLTDYMIAGRPILSCGPQYAACNHFIQEWNCGVVCETNEIEAIKAILLNLMQTSHDLDRYAHTAFEVVQNHFEKKRVSQHLYEFICQTAALNSGQL